MSVETKPLPELTEDAIRILGREIGVVDTIRFLNQFRTGSGNYTEERRQLFEGLTLEEAICEIRKMQLESQEK